MALTLENKRRMRMEVSESRYEREKNNADVWSIRNTHLSVHYASPCIGVSEDIVRRCEFQSNLYHIHWPCDHDYVVIGHSEGLRKSEEPSGIELWPNNSVKTGDAKQTSVGVPWRLGQACPSWEIERCRDSWAWHRPRPFPQARLLRVLIQS